MEQEDNNLSSEAGNVLLEPSFPIFHVLNQCNSFDESIPTFVNLEAPLNVPCIDTKCLTPNIPIVSLTDEHGATFLETTDKVFYYQPVFCDSQLENPTLVFSPSEDGLLQCNQWLLTAPLYNNRRDSMVHSDEGHIHYTEDYSVEEERERNKRYLRRGFSDDTVKLHRQVSLHCEPQKPKIPRSRRRRLGPRAASEPNGYRKKVVKRHEYEVNQSLAHSDEADSDDSETRTLNNGCHLHLVRRNSEYSNGATNSFHNTSNGSESFCQSNATNSPNSLGTTSTLNVPVFLRRTTSDSILNSKPDHNLTVTNIQLELPQSTPDPIPNAIPNDDLLNKQDDNQCNYDICVENMLSPEEERITEATELPNVELFLSLPKVGNESPSDEINYQTITQTETPLIVAKNCDVNPDKEMTNETIILQSSVDLDSSPSANSNVEELELLINCPTQVDLANSRRRTNSEQPIPSKVLIYGFEEPPRLTFTQSLAFPIQPASPLVKKRHDGHMESEYRFNTYAKVITLVIFALVLSFIVGFLYKIFR